MTDFDVLLNRNHPEYAAEWRRWWKENQAAVRAAVCKSYGWLGDARIADALQEARLRAHDKIETFRKEPCEGIETRFLNWMKTIACNWASDEAADVKRRKEDEEDDSVPGASEGTIIGGIDKRNAVLALLDGLKTLRPWEKELVMFVKLDPRCNTIKMARDLASIPADYPALRKYVLEIHKKDHVGPGATADVRAAMEKRCRARLRAAVSRAVRALKKCVERRFGREGVLS